MRKALVAGGLAALAVLSTGCSNMSNTQQRTLSGASIGAIAGGVGTAIFHGNPIVGVAVGAAVGAGGGYLYDEHKKEQAQEYNSGYAAGQRAGQSQ